MVANDLDVLVIVVNNGMLGTIRMHQERHYPGRVMGTDLVNPDFAAFARSFGAYGERVEEHRRVRGGARARAGRRRARAARAGLRPRGADAAPVALGGARPGRARGGGLIEALHTWQRAAHRGGGPRARALGRGGHAAPPPPHRGARAPAHGHHAHPRDALARAREAPLGLLAGVPLLVKDIFDTAGVRTTYGSGIFRDHVPLRSATSVRRLLDAGAIMLGKANLHEFAWGVTSRNRAYGAVVNSARPDRIPGGSSGGNASALAAGLCALGLGTDTGASIRLPAAACGVAGFKPAFGSVPGRRSLAARAVLRPRRSPGALAR